MMRKVASAAFIAALLSSSALAQPIPPAGGGGGGGGGSGTVTSVATGKGLTGGPITGSGTISTTELLGNSGAAVTGTTYTVDLTNDLATQLLFTGSSASAWSLGAGSNGMGFDVVNRGTANITVTATGNINGASTLVVYPGTWAHIFYGNSTWNAENIPLGSSTQFGALKTDGVTIFANNGVASVLPAQSFLNGNTYIAAPFGTSGTHQNQNLIWFTPIIVPIGKTISNIYSLVSVVQSGGNAQFQLYANDPTVNKPIGAPLCSTNVSQSTASLGITTSACGGVTTTQIMWLASNQDNNVATLWSINSGNPWTSWLVGTPNASDIYNVATNVGTSFTTSSTFGTWPTNPTVSVAKVSFAIIPNLAYQIN